MKVGRSSNIGRICAHRAPVQASNPATIQLDARIQDPQVGCLVTAELGKMETGEATSSFVPARDTCQATFRRECAHLTYFCDERLLEAVVCLRGAIVSINRVARFYELAVLPKGILPVESRVSKASCLV
jgi:hypothetical protein